MSNLNSTLGALLFPSVLWRSKSSSICLTFDDGPHPAATPRVLDVLQKFDIKATFFLLGEHVVSCPQLAEEIATSGHAVGCHSMFHRSLFLKPLEVQRTEIARGKAAIEKYVGKSPQIFRPPYGYFDFSTLRVSAEEGMKFVMWDVDSKDFGKQSNIEMIRRLTRAVRPGSIVLFHDNEQTATRGSEYLSAIIERLLERGHTFASIRL
jgi:peptidoglycan/xylan/chitin deacetylase (PgdA/CDA1 family)